jgi:hypothetical protein
MSAQSDMFGGRQRYPNEPGFKVAGASADAARKVAPVAKGIRGRVLSHYRDRYPAGFTVDEIARDLRLSPFTARPRVSELHAQGLLEQTAIRRPNESGHSATVWRASPKAMEGISND